MDIELQKHIVNAIATLIGTGMIGGLVTIATVKIKNRPAETISTADATAKLAVNSMNLADQVNAALKKEIDQLNKKLDDTGEMLDIVVEKNRELLLANERLMSANSILVAEVDGLRAKNLELTNRIEELMARLGSTAARIEHIEHIVEVEGDVFHAPVKEKTE